MKALNLSEEERKEHDRRLHNARNKKYRATEKGKATQRNCNKVLYNANKEEYARKRRIYMTNGGNKKVRIASKKLYYSSPEARLTKIAATVKSSAKKRGLTCDTAFIDELAKSPPLLCECCNVRIDYHLNNRKTTPSFDRVDNSIGYERGNVYIVCYACNTHKSDMSIERITTILKYMTDKMKVK